MFRTSWTPKGDLAQICVEYWGMERDFGPGGSFSLTPDGYVELMVYAGTLEFQKGGAFRPWPRVSAVGLLSGPVEVRGRGLVRVLAARLHGFAAAGFLGRAVFGLVRGWPNLDATELLAAVRSGDIQSAPKFWQRALEPRTKAVLSLWPSAEAARLIAASSGDLRTPEVARILGRSRRQVERQVRASSGLSPKALAQLQRFQALRDSLWKNPAAPLSELAAQAGYSDQAHATREFRNWSGLSLLAFRRSLREWTRRTLNGNGAIIQE